MYSIYINKIYYKGGNKIMDYKNIFKAIKKQLKDTHNYDCISIDSRKKTIFLDSLKGYNSMTSFFKGLDYSPTNHIVINDIDFIIVGQAYVNGMFTNVWIKEYDQFLKDGR